MSDGDPGKLRLAAAAIVAALAGVSASAADVAAVARPLVIQRIEVGGTTQLARVEVLLDGAPAWKAERTPDGRLAVDLANTRAATGVVTRLFSSGLVSAIRISAVGVPSRPVTRLFVETRGGVEARFDAADGRFAIDLAPAGSGFPPPKAAPAPRPAPPPPPALAPALVPPVDAELAPHRDAAALGVIAVPDPARPAVRLATVPTPPEELPVAAIAAEPGGRRAPPPLPAPAPVAPSSRVIGVPTPPEPEPVSGIETAPPLAARALDPLQAAAPAPPRARVAGVPTPPEPEPVAGLDAAPSGGAPPELEVATPSSPAAEIAVVPTPPEPEEIEAIAAPASLEEDLAAPKLAAQPAPARPLAPDAGELAAVAAAPFASRGASDAPPEPLPQVEAMAPAAAAAAPRQEPARLTWLPFVDADLEPAIDAPRVEPAAPPELVTFPGEAAAPHPEATVARAPRIEEEDLGEPLAPSPPVGGPAPLALPSPPVTGTADHPWLAPPPQDPAGRELVSIEHPEPGLVRVVGDGEFAYATFKLSAPDRFVIDLEGVVSRAPRTLLKIDEGVVLRVRVSQFRSLPNPVARVIFDLSSPAIPTIERNAGGLLVRFR